MVRFLEKEGIEMETHLPTKRKRTGHLQNTGLAFAILPMDHWYASPKYTPAAKKAITLCGKKADWKLATRLLRGQGGTPSKRLVGLPQFVAAG